MIKKGLLRALRSVPVGGEIVVWGRKHQIIEVVKYKEDGDRWLNLVWSDKKGKETALEIDGQKLTVWKEIAAPKLGYPKIDCPFQYGGEEYRDTEGGVARAVSTTTKKSKTRCLVMWRVCEAKSGHKLSIELWGEEKHVYFSKGRLPATAVRVS